MNISYYCETNFRTARRMCPCNNLFPTTWESGAFAADLVDTALHGMGHPTALICLEAALKPYGRWNGQRAILHIHLGKPQNRFKTSQGRQEAHRKMAAWNHQIINWEMLEKASRNPTLVQPEMSMPSLSTHSSPMLLGEIFFFPPAENTDMSLWVTLLALLNSHKDEKALNYSRLDKITQSFSSQWFSPSQAMMLSQVALSGEETYAAWSYELTSLKNIFV